MLNEAELSALEARCQDVPLTTNTYLATDFVATLLDTVMDYYNHTAAVVKASRHFATNRWDEVRTLDELETVMERFPPDREGDRELAQYLWGNNHWQRAGQLRGLARYFRELGVDSLASLKQWANKGTYADFQGKVKGLGPTVYQWLVMRLGVETVKPDVHVLRFVSNAVGRPVQEREAIDGLETVAQRLGVKATVLDWSIWEYQRAPGG